MDNVQNNIPVRCHMENDDIKSSTKFTYFSKKPLNCPICDTEFFREDLFSGGGRLIAGQLTMDLRRLYEDNKKYGTIIPLIYAVTVCPECYFSVLSEDFTNSFKSKDKLEEATTKRIALINELFRGINFREERNIEHGLLSYILAVDCYKLIEPRYIPTIKKGICSLRASWLADDMVKYYNNPIFKTISEIFFRKAAKYYGIALGLAQNGTEPVDGTRSIGPDTDRNWGYDGFLYLAGYLNYKLSDQDQNLERKGNTLIKVRRIMGKLYGGGRASKDKPTIILNNAKDIYDEIRVKVTDIESQLGKSLE